MMCCAEDRIGAILRTGISETELGQFSTNHLISAAVQWRF
jgi:hypothetical protein